MTTSTILMVIGAGILALGLAVFQYFFRSKNRGKRTLIYTLLRFCTYFFLLILLINPSYESITYTTEKPSLAVVVDNSVSIDHLGYAQDVYESVVRFRESEPLNSTFDIQYYKFGFELNELDSLDFSTKQTNIENALTSIEKLYDNSKAPIALLSDGNQTLGRSYQYVSDGLHRSVYPIVIGDTTTYEELAVVQINANRYAYVNNKFPVEIFINYKGSQSTVASRLQISNASGVVYSENITLSGDTPSKVINTLLDAKVVGLQRYTVTLTPLENEKNKSNNSRNFGIEIIDQKSNVLILTELVHPDIGALKKGIQSNKLRSVTAGKPSEYVNKLNEYQLIILYQPTERFRTIFNEIDVLGKNYFIITGPKTDWNFLNTVQNKIQREVTAQTEDVQPIFNPSFSSFIVEDIGYDDFPPLLTSFGETTFNTELDIAFFQKIGSINTTDPLLVATDASGRRSLFLLGEGIWKWRAQSYRIEKSFEAFDTFLDKLVQYVASNKRKSRLDVTSETFYYGNGLNRISAQYFNKNYEFDANANLSAIITNKDSQEKIDLPFILKGNYYELDISNLGAGDYKYIVKVENSGITKSGNFTVIPFETEKQFVSANLDDLKLLAEKSDGQLYDTSTIDSLFQSLMSDNRFKPIEKSTKNIVPLIDWKWLLGLIALSLAVEWFMRKYNGLI